MADTKTSGNFVTEKKTSQAQVRPGNYEAQKQMDQKITPGEAQRLEKERVRQASYRVA